MQKSNLWLSLLPLVLTACGPTGNKVIIAQVQSVVDAALRLTDVGPSLILILLLLMLLVVVILSCLAGMLFILQLSQLRRTFWQLTSAGWMGGSNAHRKDNTAPDLYQQMLNEQQWLFTHLLSQSHEKLDLQEHLQEDICPPPSQF